MLLAHLLYLLLVCSDAWQPFRRGGGSAHRRISTTPITQRAPRSSYVTLQSHAVDKAFELAGQHQIDFLRDGHLKLENVFSAGHLTQKLLPSIQALLADDTSTKLAAYRHKVRVTLGRDDYQSMSLEKCEEALKTVDQVTLVVPPAMTMTMTMTTKPHANRWL